MSPVLFTVRRRDAAWAAALTVLLSLMWVARGDIAGAGEDPPGEGIAVVYVAVGTNFPDALGVGPGAAANGAPIILVPTNPPIPTPTAVELERLDPREVIIIGGTSAISAAMEAAITALLPNATIERLAGGNRYETNALFSASVFPVESWVSIPAAAFTAGSPDLEDVALTFGTADNESAGGELIAPVSLPDGAEILEVTMVGNDSDGGQNVTLTLNRLDNDGVTTAVVTFSSFGNGGAFEIPATAINAGTEIVDNGTYAYTLVASDLDGSIFLRKVMIRYRLGAPGG